MLTFTFTRKALPDSICEDLDLLGKEERVMTAEVQRRSDAAVNVKAKQKLATLKLRGSRREEQEAERKVHKVCTVLQLYSQCTPTVQGA
jgi:hypothetical protein